MPYRGLSPALNDLMAGNVDILFDGFPAIIPHVREGRLRALAVGSASVSPMCRGWRPQHGELVPGTDMDMEFWYCSPPPPAPHRQWWQRCTRPTVAAPAPASMATSCCLSALPPSSIPARQLH